jgi:hypothetical protein
MGQFCSFLNATTLKEVHLNGRLFTWSNESSTQPWRGSTGPLSREWDELFPHHDLHSLASICSYHVLLLLWTDNMFSYHKRFHFRAWWPRFPGFIDVVRHAWNCRHADPYRRLDWFLRNTARFLKRWSDHITCNVRVQLEVTKEVVHRLEMARDHRARRP